MSSPYLSIIVPAHNEERRLPGTLERVLNFLKAQDYSWEILVVENGSQDRTLELARQFESSHAGIRVVHEPLRGKGLAVRRGMLEALGEYRFMCDADLSMPIEQINRFIPPLLTDTPISIASREARGAIRYNEPAYRHLGGRLINLMIRLLALPGLQDTQCGFKCFRRDAAEDLFSCQTLTGWSFDIEILFVARQRGYRIFEIPIPWYFNPESKLNAFQDALHMLVDIIVIQQNNRQGLYQRRPSAVKTSPSK